MSSPDQKRSSRKGRSVALFVWPLAILLTAAVLTAKGRFHSPCAFLRTQPKNESLDLAVHQEGLHFDPELRYASDLRQAQHLLATWPEGKPKGAYFTLSRNSDLNGLRLTISEFESRFNRRANYPYIIVNNEDFDENFVKTIESLTDAPVLFGRVPKEHWSLPAHVNRTEAEAAWAAAAEAKMIYGGSESYRHMCRYFSGYFMFHPLLEGFDYYWRLDTDVQYSCMLDVDPFEIMVQRNKTYGWNILMKDFRSTIKTLWPTTVNFIYENTDLMNEQNCIRAMVPHLELAGARESALATDYDTCHFWSNFEIGRLSFFRGEAYQAYFRHLDMAKGFFMERWGDAPVHTLAVALLLNPNEVQFFNEIGYEHTGIQHCPKGDLNIRNCRCDPDNDWAGTSGGTCYAKFRRCFG